MTNVCDISSEIALRWTSRDHSDDKSTLVQVMAWCRQATSHYLNQCWPRSLPPYGVTRPQWVNCESTCWAELAANWHVKQHWWKHPNPTNLKNTKKYPNVEKKSITGACHLETWPRTKILISEFLLSVFSSCPMASFVTADHCVVTGHCVCT